MLIEMADNKYQKTFMSFVTNEAQLPCSNYEMLAEAAHVLQDLQIILYLYFDFLQCFD